jgi:hypothetical protein
VSQEIKPAFTKKVEKKVAGAGNLMVLGIFGLLAVLAALLFSMSMGG